MARHDKNARVVVIGGTGNFGARICRRLASEAGMQVIATGRHPGRVEGCDVPVESLDTEAAGFAYVLARLQPDVVIHCAGPFQGQDYRVAAAALASRAHYIDLADGRDFVVRFANANHALAVRADRLAVTGASTLPALSSAVIDHLARSFAQLDEIEITIAPGQRAPRGIATMAAVLSYAGRPLQWWKEGRWQVVYGWQELRAVKFPFGLRRAAVCDVPDLALLPERYEGVRTVEFRAALEVPIQQHALWCLAGVRRLGIPVPAERWAPALNRAVGWFDRFGTDCGGMSVRVRGQDRSGRQRNVTWHVVARSNHGPEIPCMAAALLARKLITGTDLPRGAQPCMGLLTLEEFESEFARWHIRTMIDESPPVP
jgi:hypothetical protein